MPNLYTRTGDLNALVGAAQTPRVFVRPLLPSGEALIDSTNKRIKLGTSGPLAVASDGTFSVELVGTDSTDLNVAANTWYYQIVVDYTDPGTRTPETWKRSFALTSSGDFADAGFLGDLSPLAVQSSSAYALEAKAYRDEADAARQAAEDLIVADLGTTDGQTKALIEAPGSQTAQALSATIQAGAATVEEGLLTTPRPFAPINSAVVTTMQSGHGYTNFSSTAASVTDDDTDFLLGGQSLRIVTKTDNTAASVQKAGQSINAVGKSLRLLVKVDDLTNLTELILYAGNDTLTSYYQWTIADADPTFAQHYMKGGEWVWVTLGFNEVGVVGTPDRTNITLLRLRSRATLGNSITVRWGGVALVDESPAFPNGVVSFAYDDSYATHYTEARKALDKHGFTGTFYTICDLIDSGAGWMTTAQLQALDRAGHEIAAHAYTLADHQTGFHNMTAQAVAEDLRNMRKWLTARGFTGGDHLAYPQGGYNATVLDVAGKFHASARTVNRRMLETLRPSDALRLRSFSVSNTDTVATVKSKIDRALANKGWLILTFHSLVTTPTVTNHYSIADHQEIVDYCKSLGIAVQPVGDVLSRLNGSAPVSSSAPTTAAVINQALGNSDSRIQVVDRFQAAAGLTVPTGEMHLSCFTPIIDMQVGFLTARTSATAWTGQTLVRLGLFTTDPATGALTLVAATANDVTTFAAANTIYRKPLSTGGGLPATYTLKAGQRYAVGVLGVGQTTGNLLASAVNSTLSARAPRLCGRVTGLADLPSTATLVETGTALWAEVG